MRTRREFIQQVAAYGGSASAAMAALELLAPARATAFAPMGDGRGTKVVILGAGVAGLCAAYELGKLGYDCTMLEARARAGGRVWTIRGGTTHTEIGGATQTAAFAEGHYLNPGPARVPQHHVTMDYYREFGIAVEQFGNLNFNAYYHSTKAPPERQRLRIRQARLAFRGEAAELLAKSIASDALDAPLTADDKEKLLASIASDGGLDAKTRRFTNAGGMAGYRAYPAAGDNPGVPDDPLGMLDLARYGFGTFDPIENEITQQPAMFQPVGGIDALPRAMAAKLAARITYNAPVTAIRKTPRGVRITYTDAGIERAIEAAYCICTIPLPVLRKIPADFSAPFAASIARVHYMSSFKIGLAFKRRFWEEDDRIFSGISRTDQSITQIWYPSYGYFSPSGAVLTGAYNTKAAADAFAALSPAARETRALAEGAKIHPQYATEFVSSFSVAWAKTPYNEGAWVSWNDDTRTHDYPILSQPDGPIYLAGEHMSYINAWQAGALESARSVVLALHERVQRSGS
jgi:monoamine oxidase